MGGGALARFLHLDALPSGVVERLLSRALRLEREPLRDDLRGRVLGLVFLNPSLRTLSSLQAGMAQLGGTTFVLTPGQGTWSLAVEDGAVMDGVEAEHVKEAAPVLAQYADAIGLRAFAGLSSLEGDQGERTLQAFDDACPKPLLNLESAFDHPCQALADWKTLDDLEVPRRGGKIVLHWTWHPKALPLAVPSAVVRMAAQRGMEVVVARPRRFALPAELRARAEGLAARTGGSFRETDDRREACADAHVIYAKSWCATDPYGDAAGDAAARSDHRDWMVAESSFTAARSGARFMHCLPVRRNVVVADEVLDGPRSVVVQQAGNRLHAQKAVLLEMLTDPRPERTRPGHEER